MEEKNKCQIENNQAQGPIIGEHNNVTQNFYNGTIIYSESQSSLAVLQERKKFIGALQLEYQKWLSGSLREVALITLGLHKRMDITQSTMQFIFRRTLPPIKNIAPQETSILQIFDESPLGLLIVGEPGAGKTTLLFELCLELLQRAEHDQLHPIPVIFNLASWATKKSCLRFWLRNELKRLYQISPDLITTWIKSNHVLCLLDGLDEMPLTSRRDCIEAINVYRSEHRVPIVVCSRQQAYVEQDIQLSLSSAVLVQPLEKQQIETYLQQLGASEASFRSIYEQNTMLQELMTTPLLLNVATLAYRDQTVENLSQLCVPERQQELVSTIFDQFVCRKLSQRKTDYHFTNLQMIKYLRLIAGHMKQHNDTVFYLEQLQPDYLPNATSGLIYRLLVLFVIGCMFVPFLAMLWIPLFTTFFGAALGNRYIFYLIPSLIIVFTLGGVNKHAANPIVPKEVFFWSWESVKQREKISWKESLIGSPIILFFGAFVGIPVGIVRGWFWGFLGGGICMILVTLLLLLIRLLINILFEGVRFKVLEKRTMINQGIWKSFYHGLASGLIGTFIVWVILGSLLLLNYILGSLTQLSVLYVLVFGFAIGVLCWLMRGGDAFIEHFILRFLLLCTGTLPWKCHLLLEEADDYILLQKVWGGYSFLHISFRDYFASLNVDSED